MAHEGRIVRYLIVSAIFTSNYLSTTRYRLQNSPNFEPDFVVIGGGSAGAVVTTRLVDAGYNVVLLERGGSGNHYTDIPFIDHEIARQNEFVEQFFVREKKACLSTEEGCILKVGNSLGGGSTHNAMNFVRGSPIDYDEWEKLGAEGWSFRDVLPYFMKLEDARNVSGANPKFRGMSGPIAAGQTTFNQKVSDALLEGLREMGFKEGDNNVNPTKFGLAQMSIRNGTRSSSLNSYLDRVVGSEKLKVFCKSLVTRIIFSKDDPIRAVAVEFFHETSPHPLFIRPKLEVILSAGALGSPKVLMLSGIGPRKHLERVGIEVILDKSGVGGNFQNHPIIGLDYKIPTFHQYELLWKDIQNYNEKRIGCLVHHDRALLGAFQGKDSSGPYDTRFQMMVNMKNSNSQDPDEKSLIYDNEAKLDMLTVLLTLLRVKSRGRIRLNPENPYGQVHITINELSEQEDVDGVVEMMRFALKYMNMPSIQQQLQPVLLDDPRQVCQQYKVQDAPDTPYLECIARQYSISGHHYGGTCKMGHRGDPTAVVDNRARVIGVVGLRVVDASIMPVVPRGNTNIPTIMIAEKVSDMIIIDAENRKRD